MTGAARREVVWIDALWPIRPLAGFVSEQHVQSDLEENFAALISEIDGIEAQFANSERARKRLAAVRQGIERLYTQTAAERRRIELSESTLQESENYNKILFQQSHRAIVVFDPEAGCFIDSNQAAAGDIWVLLA